jgi:hypothetical protein
MFKSITSFSFIIVVGIFLISCDSEINSSQNTTDSDAINIQSGKKQTVGSGAKSIGKVTVGTDASVWDSDIPRDDTEGIYPIGGSGQINGEFAIAERKGIQIGMRIQERREGTYEASGKRVGVYESETGFSSGTRAVWNYDWHVDLRNAEGKLAGKTLGDYDLTLETDIAESIFGFNVPFDLTFGDFNNGVLYQGSFNPDFGNDTFDPTLEATYSFRLVLTPKTFNGGPLAIKVQVNVTD